MRRLTLLIALLLPALASAASLCERVTLEMSLKPFRSLEEPAIRAVCEEIFRQWDPLLRQSNGCAIMLWTADGSEILDYRGKLEDEFEWAKWVGIGTPPQQASAHDPHRKGLHATPHLYMKDPPRMTYAALKKIVQCLKEVGQQRTGKPVVVGATFDPGPEFAKSSFKYERHPEIAIGDTMGSKQWVACDARLKGDTVAYAGFPNGIPDNTSLGTFLGRQSQHFLKDLGFDYIWLSNGFGFSLSAWSVKGPAFDGKKFDVAAAQRCKNDILAFWRDFRKECPSFPIETRGSNLTTGNDVSSAGSPILDIYRGGFNLTAPPNSPWAALDGDFGLEIVGYLSHIAELPSNNRFPFRYYLHDPWWLNSPWFDRYGREPQDIYLPLAIARLDAAGRVTRPANVEFLTIDDSFGRMPVEGPIEVIPHILTGLRHYSDQPGPVTWIYPFEEYHERAFTKDRLDEPFFGDWFIRNAVNRGLPLNTVVSTGNFLASLKTNPRAYHQTVLMAPVPDAGSALEAALLQSLKDGRDVLLYGPVTHAGSALLDALNLQRSQPIAGELKMQTSLRGDVISRGALASTLNHRDALSAGGIDTILKDPARGDVEVCASVAGRDAQRVYAVLRRGDNGAGRLAWVRGSFCATVGRLPVADDPAKLFPAELLLRWMLARFGYEQFFELPTLATREPLVLAARSRNGWFFSGHCPSTSVRLALRFPHGAPILVGHEAWLKDGRAHYTLPRAWHREVRCLVDQKEEGEISCIERHSGHMGIERRLLLKGLKDAAVHFYPEKPGGRVIMSLNHAPHNEESLPFASEEDGRRLVLRKVTGNLLISW